MAEEDEIDILGDYSLDGFLTGSNEMYFIYIFKLTDILINSNHVVICQYNFLDQI